MPAYFDDDITGDGDEALGTGISVIYVAFHCTVVGGVAREIEAAAHDRVLRLGYFSLGRLVTMPGDSQRTYWIEPQHFNYMNCRWQPSPNNSSSGAFTMLADRIRWHLSGGAEGRLYVYGL